MYIKKGTEMKFKTFALMLFLVILRTDYALAQDNDSKFKFGIEFRILTFDITGDVNDVRLNNVPEHIRQIPVHEKDTYLSTHGSILTIPDTTVKVENYSDINPAYMPSVMPEVNIKGFVLRGGLNLRFPTHLPTVFTENHREANSFVYEEMPEGVIRELNQRGSGTARGIGHSLVFYGLEPERKPSVGWIGESEIKISRTISLLGGVSSNKYKFRLVSGWDRYNSFEKYRSFPAFSSRLYEKYVGIRFGQEIGSLIVNVGQTNFINKLDPSLKPSAFLQEDKDAKFFMNIGLTLRFKL